MKLLLLDLDGTVREPKSDAKFICYPDDQRLIIGVTEAIARYADWVIMGITNQGGVAAGYKSLEEAVEEQLITLRLLPPMRKIYFCSDFKGREGYLVRRGNIVKIKNPKYLGLLRKPNPGMLLLAKDSCLGSIDKCLMIGDRPEDEQAARAANIPFVWADDWRFTA